MYKDSCTHSFFSYFCKKKENYGIKDKGSIEGKNVSVIQLADMLGVSRSACYQFINGNPSAYRLETIARALNVNVGDLFEPIVEE